MLLKQFAEERGYPLRSVSIPEGIRTGAHLRPNVLVLDGGSDSLDDLLPIVIHKEDVSGVMPPDLPASDVDGGELEEGCLQEP